jgi:RimJ/RimL family protein N-acetyltransferase
VPVAVVTGGPGNGAAALVVNGGVPMLPALPDGTAYALRPIGPDDRDALAAFMARLSRDTVLRRFLVAKPHLSSSELRHLTDVDQIHHLALVAEPVGDPGRLLGVARCVRLAPGGEVADFAIVVADEHQGQGVGTTLARALADAARAAGVRRFSATTLADNAAAVRLMRTFAARLHDAGVSGGVRDLTLDLAA